MSYIDIFNFNTNFDIGQQNMYRVLNIFSDNYIINQIVIEIYTLIW